MAYGGRSPALGAGTEHELPCSLGILNFILQMMKQLREVNLANHAGAGVRTHIGLILGLTCIPSASFKHQQEVNPKASEFLRL